MAELTFTDRPVLVLADVLGMATVQQGQPHVLTGDVGLDGAVRWVHIAAGSGIAGLLAGGELILTTGAGWPRDSASLLAEVNELLQAGISGLFIEHGTRFTSIPDQLIELCRSRGVALVELTRETSFVRVTEQVHRSILQEQSEALTARDEVQGMLTTLGLNRAPVDYVVEQLAATLETTVVLENTLGEMVSWAGANAQTQPSTALGLWPRNTASHLPEGWDSVAVEARDSRWGTLIAQPGPAHPAGRHTVLELGAVAIALGRLADPFERSDRWMSTNAKRLLDDLLDGRFRSDEEIASQLGAMGIGFAGNDVHAFSLRLPSAQPDELDALLAAIISVVSARGKIVTAKPTESHTQILGLLAVPKSLTSASELERRLTEQLSQALQDKIRGQARLILGPEANQISELIASLEMANTPDFFEVTAEAKHVAICVVGQRPLAYLINELKNDERLNRFARGVLAPIVEYERVHGGDLLRVLNAYVRHPTNRSHAAHVAKLSRSVFYQRLDLIEELLEVDLADGTVIASLLLALETAPHLHLAG